MVAENRCRGCGNVLLNETLNGLCPVCLFREGLAGDGSAVATGPFMSGTQGATSALATLDKSLGGLPHVLLRDSDLNDGPAPLVQPSSPELPAVGNRTGRLQLLGEIARGGMGAVLKGRDPDLGRDLAVKVLLESHRDKPELIRRFVEEAQIGGQLQHPGIVPIYELGAFADHRPYFAMKLVKGRTLSSLLDERSDSVHDRSRFLSIFESVCQTIAYAHARGVIHRDLKPSNIMVTPHDHAKLLDLGLAIVRGQESGDRKLVNGKRYLVGTKDYLAPEQAADPTSVDARADIYALGCTLYFALTGQPPFPGGTTKEKIDRHKSDEPIPVSQLNPNVPAAFIGLVRHMMAKIPERRIASAVLVRERLLPWAGNDQEKPLDRREDKEYQEAVFALETLESPPELLTDVVSRTIPERPRHRRRQRSKSRPLLEAPHEPAKPHPFAASFVAAISAALLTTLLMGGVLFWLSRH
jgi:eukaryotic-like serine/threonine-protein kinase